MDNFERLLHLIPYLSAHPGVTFSHLAKEFGVRPQKIEADLKDLWVTCGLPGGAGGDLIDFSFSHNGVQLTFSAGLDEPLRLTSMEALSLIVALEALLEIETRLDPTAIIAAKNKIEIAYKTKKTRGRVLQRKDAFLPFSIDSHTDSYVLHAKTVHQAIEQETVLKMNYYSSTRDVVTDRVIDPLEIISQTGQEYVVGWCHSSSEYRTFRLDRIRSCSIDLDTQRCKSLHEYAQLQNPALISGRPLGYAIVRVQARYRWMIEHYNLSVLATGDESILALAEFYSRAWFVRFVLAHQEGMTVVNSHSPDFEKARDVVDTQFREKHPREWEVINTEGFANEQIRNELLAVSQSVLRKYEFTENTNSQ